MWGNVDVWELVFVIGCFTFCSVGLSCAGAAFFIRLVTLRVGQIFAGWPVAAEPNGHS